MKLDDMLSQVYKTPHRVSTAVFFIIHTALTTTQAAMGNNYITEKYDQFMEHPVITALEISIPYIVPYAINSCRQYIAKRKKIVF